MIGVCKWFDDSKGFGFITDASGADYFAHWRNILGKGHRSLFQGDHCQFDVQSNERGKLAINILTLQPPEKEK